MEKKLEAALAGVHKAFGKGSVMLLGSGEKMEVDVIPTGIEIIDRDILLIGGIPRGRVTEIFGTESGGKTTLTLQIIAQAQKLGGQALFIDAEHAFDPNYARALGVNTDELLISQPESGEEALEIAEALIKSGEISVAVVDSVSALVPRAELDGDMGAPQMGLQARLMGSAMRKLTGVTSRSNTALIFINQVRDKIGVMFGNPETTSGGRALKFYASVRLDVRRAKAIKKSDDTIGAETKIKTIKNKCAAPYREALVPLMYGRGFVNEE